MPIQQFFPERHLLESGRPNYWGYAPIALRAPHAGYATAGDGSQVRECREMIRRLHDAGLEVILDIVLNHTAEGGHRGCRYSWHGIDPRGTYRHTRSGRLVDWTGCGNTLDVRSAAVRRYLLAALRTWVLDYGVDGFRLDLGVVLGRDPGDAFEPERAWLFRLVEEDPVLASVKWSSEPWDLGPDGYRRGAFPKTVREWDDRFRDDVRRFWIYGDGPAAYARSMGAGDGRGSGEPARVQFVVAHDGNTLADVVAYDRKHNLPNGEDNRDGHDGEVRGNHGEEGPTNDSAILLRRRLARRHLVLSLALAPGIPLLAHGDEIGRTQEGNNNAYCQDGPLTWLDWERADLDDLEFFRRAFALRTGVSGRRSARSLDGGPADVERLPHRFALTLPSDRILLVNATLERARFHPCLAQERTVLLSSREGLVPTITAFEPLHGPEMRLLGPSEA